jgi:hypothetical protein
LCIRWSACLKSSSLGMSPISWRRESNQPQP